MTDSNVNSLIFLSHELDHWKNVCPYSLEQSCLCSSFQLEAIIVEMQDTKSGLKGSDQKLNVTTIPHVISGETKTHKQMDTQFHKHVKHFFLSTWMKTK